MQSTDSIIRRTIGLLLFFSVAGASCQPMPDGSYPASSGFNAAASDPEAIRLADLTMVAMGGYDAWSKTRYVSWEFFGSRRHVWDKHTGDIRIDGRARDFGESSVVLMNLHSKQGRAWTGGREILDDTELASMLDAAEAAWINDSYWLVMPYKLKDSGVTLCALGPGAMADGREADVIQVTFEGVGRTPHNKYRVYVARDTGLVEQWDFFATVADAEPAFSTPWADWQRYGRIMLSGDRGMLRGRPAKLDGLAVYDRLPVSVMTDPALPDLAGSGR